MDKLAFLGDLYFCEKWTKKTTTTKIVNKVDS